MPWALRRWRQEDQKYKVIFYHTSRLSWDRLSQHEMQRGSRAHLFALVVLSGTVSHDIRLEAAIQRMASYSHPPVRRDSRCASPCPAYTLQHCRTYVLLLELDKTIAACILKS